jgi:site-specific DNA-methyltransferase (adenine-specific)
MQQIPDGSIDMVLCDLPYGTTQCRWDTCLDLSKLWEHYLRVVKQTGVILLFAQTPFDKVLGMSKIDLLRYEWIYEKTSATGHLNTKKMPLKAHENVLVFYRKLPTYNPQKTTGHKPVNSFTKRNGDGEIYGDTVEVSGGGSTERYPRSVLKFKTDKQLSSLHPTQKPVELCEYLIRTYTNEGDTVLDNCMGSGTTGVSCINIGRSFIGIEKEQKYFEIAKQRLGKP